MTPEISSLMNRPSNIFFPPSAMPRQHPGVTVRSRPARTRPLPRLRPRRRHRHCQRCAISRTSRRARASCLRAPAPRDESLSALGVHRHQHRYGRLRLHVRRSPCAHVETTPSPQTAANLVSRPDGPISRIMLIKRLPTGFIIPARPVMASKPPSRADWVHEIKHDGYRMIVRRDGPAIRLYSRNA